VEPTWSVEELLSSSDSVADIGEEELQRLAMLSALKIPEDKVKSLCRDLNKMNHFMAAIKKVDVSEVPDPVMAANVDFELQTRPDAPVVQMVDGKQVTTEAAGATTILANAALKRGSFFAVPNTRETSS